MPTPSTPSPRFPVEGQISSSSARYLIERVFGAVDVDIARIFPLHVEIGGDQGGELGGGRIDVVEAEDVEQEDAAVVEEVFDGFLGQFQVSVSEGGDVGDGADAVDLGHNTLHGKIPVLVEEGADAQCKKRHVTGLEIALGSAGQAVAPNESLAAPDPVPDCTIGRSTAQAAHGVQKNLKEIFADIQAIQIAHSASNAQEAEWDRQARAREAAATLKLMQEQAMVAFTSEWHTLSPNSDGDVDIS
ncbi:hypothetical protein GQ44DRAFT_773012 [Phaeosphaeriaceae sp. PMI808]|nr:hypothetical protein GQ44DRAFT_773012 [Phaeosphaeriaceae sp. PMI808]